MHLRRLTRVTNAFSKSLNNHKAAVTLYIAFYNFCRGHQTHKEASPAMAAGLTDHVWSIAELLTTTYSLEIRGVNDSELWHDDLRHHHERWNHYRRGQHGAAS